MAYYSREEMEQLLTEYPQYRDKLFCRGFLITDNSNLDVENYPFYGEWCRQIIKTSKGKDILVLTHRQAHSYIYKDGDITYFLVGHAYNPYSMEYEELAILHDLAQAMQISEDAYWSAESELTGVFCTGYVREDNIVFSTDCTGMQLVYYGQKNGNMYITSHSKLVADLCGFEQDDYITRLVNSKFYRYWGTFLPGDRSPYLELKRVVPNFFYECSLTKAIFSFKRYYPLAKIEEVQESKYENVLENIAQILENSLVLISKKWPEKRAAISVTGGRDSTTTLAAARSVYEELSYFSYSSKETEKVDAEAAHNLCKYLGLEHTIYNIPDESELYKDIEIIKKILECNAGCIGHNNLNDVKKRIYLDTIHDFDVEIKSWVDELSRGEAQNKYNTRRFPKKPTAGYYRCMWKVIVNPRLIWESNRIFKEYLHTYYDQDVLNYLPWMDFFFWEFSWSSGEGTFLTSEHKYSDEITIPYNNRCLLNTMFTVPLEKRLNSQIQIDVIRKLDKRIEDSKVYVKNAAHTNMWSFLIRTYLRIFSKF